jgi:hypothetical protein|tara:strand:+ start:5518 stop:5898 length:381 start_codon:yes stop_codon:yes gene_type:complete
MSSSNNCCLCGSEYERSGCNPWPLSESGRCCDRCDSLKVTPRRLVVGCGFSEETAKEIGEATWNLTRTFSGLTAEEWFAVVNDPEKKLLHLWNPSFDAEGLEADEHEGNRGKCFEMKGEENVRDAK